MDVHHEHRSPRRNSPQGARHGWRAFLRQHRDVLSEDDSAGLPNRTAAGCPKGEVHGCTECTRLGRVAQGTAIAARHRGGLSFGYFSLAVQRTIRQERIETAGGWPVGQSTWMYFVKVTRRRGTESPVRIGARSAPYPLLTITMLGFLRQPNLPLSGGKNQRRLRRPPLSASAPPPPSAPATHGARLCRAPGTPRIRRCCGHGRRCAPGRGRPTARRGSG